MYRWTALFGVVVISMLVSVQLSWGDAPGSNVSAAAPCHPLCVLSDATLAQIKGGGDKMQCKEGDLCGSTNGCNEDNTVLYVPVATDKWCRATVTGYQYCTTGVGYPCGIKFVFKNGSVCPEGDEYDTLEYGGFSSCWTHN